MRKLLVWQRLGVVLSVLWMIGGGLWQRVGDVDKAQSFMGRSYKICTELKAQAGNYDFKPCMDSAAKDFEIFMVGSWGNVAIMAIAPVLLGWLAVYVFLWTKCWVLAGRRHA